MEVEYVNACIFYQTTQYRVVRTLSRDSVWSFAGSLFAIWRDLYVLEKLNFVTKWQVCKEVSYRKPTTGFR